MSESFFDRVHKNDTLHSPDVLSCLANLSNDEVFTPPEVVNQMLDMLPQHLFSDPSAKFLDPACKTGVFLREIAKRLLVGLESLIPDLEERIEHIYKNQLYGIAITELTSLISRRSLYCSKYPNGDYSICKFDNPEGNIRFKKIKHTWEGAKCRFCGASKSEYDRGLKKETYAYEFIHIENYEEIKNMKFDVIISNPPYHLSDGGGGQGASSSPIYQKFVMQAKNLNPRYISMITPSKWFVGGKGLDEYREDMLNDRHIKYLVDYVNASDCFPGVAIAGGVSYFLWENDYSGPCNITTVIDEKRSSKTRELLEEGSDIFIRYNDAISIFNKVRKHNEKTFDNLVSIRNPFNFSTSFRGKKTGAIKCYTSQGYGYVNKGEITGSIEDIDKYKVFVGYANGNAVKQIPYSVISKPFLGKPLEICNDTYLMIGPFKSEKHALNAISYMKTKFFRFLLCLKKTTPVAAKKTYNFIPNQDYSKEWTDEELFKKYKLSKEEVSFIEYMIKPLDEE